RWQGVRVAQFGGVAQMVPHSCGGLAGRLLDFYDRAWRSAFELVVLAVVRQVRLVVTSMQQRGSGAILKSTSSAVKEPIANIALSNVLRASVSALAKTLALELASTGIRVNQVIPGRIGTDRVTEIDAIN